VNFFEYQDRARTSTTKLLLLFAVAIAALVGVTSYFVAMGLAVVQTRSGRPVDFQGPMPIDVILGTATVIVSVVLLGALYRIAQLRGGGRVIAESMGGRLLSRHDASVDEQKILNVVEEMALASGLPVPPVYVIEDDAINAFAAGYRQQDAVIGITRGAIKLLNRDELQGVIAHEFSHIFNGDMRLNLRLIGWLHGLLLIGLIGAQLLRVRGMSRERSQTAGGILAIGIGLTILGYTGVFFGNLIKSAVSRQREFLADASAVQFTRNPEGIGNALKKIGGYPLGSRLMMHEANEISHMLFGEGEMRRGIGGLFATHPPLAERIKRIDPRWDGQLINPEKQREISYSTLPEEQTSHDTSAKTAMNAVTLSAALVDAVGTASAQSLGFAQTHLSEVPDTVRQHLHTPLEASLLMHGVLIAQSQPAIARKQLELLQQQLPPASFTLLANQLKLLIPLSRELDITLVELAQPALKQLSPDQLQQFLQLTNQLINSDGEITLQEWGLGRLLHHYLDSSHGVSAKLALDQCYEACRVLLSALAVAGHDGADAEAAFAAAVSSALLPSTTMLPTDIAALDAAMNQLIQLKPLHKPRLLKAMVACVEHDGKLTGEELDLLRVVAALLDCPLPPLH
jgi:Zn-dependent protease with chaperone function